MPLGRLGKEENSTGCSELLAEAKKSCPEIIGKYIDKNSSTWPDWPSGGPTKPPPGCYLKTEHCGGKAGGNVWHQNVQNEHYEYDWWGNTQKKYFSEDGCAKRADEVKRDHCSGGDVKSHFIPPDNERIFTPMEVSGREGCYFYNTDKCASDVSGTEYHLLDDQARSWWTLDPDITDSTDCDNKLKERQKKCSGLKANYLYKGSYWPTYGPQLPPPKGCYIKTTNCTGDNWWHKDAQKDHYAYDWFTQTRDSYLSEDGCNKRATEIKSLEKCDNVEGFYMSSS